MSNNDILKSTTALRDEAWRALVASPQFVAFKALNGAVLSMGGERHEEFNDLVKDITKPVGLVARAIGGGIGRAVANGSRRLSHADAVEKVLHDLGRPQTGADLMRLAEQLGASIGGTNPVANFTSSLSRDPRFYSFRLGAQYFWWLKGVPLPENMNEAEPTMLVGLNGSASSSSSQEGGDDHAATTAH